MNEINIYLTDLVTEGRLTHPEAEAFMDCAYDMELDNEDDDKIESTITQSVEDFLKEHAK